MSKAQRLLEDVLKYVNQYHMFLLFMGRMSIDVHCRRCSRLQSFCLRTSFAFSVGVAHSPDTIMASDCLVSRHSRPTFGKHKQETQTKEHLQSESMLQMC